MTLVATAALSMLGASAASANGVNSGNATITQTNGSTPITTAQGTPDPPYAFTFQLPTGSACTHDTATFSYHIYSYLVPSTVDPATLTFGSTGPSQGHPLYDTTGTPYIAHNTAPTTGVVPQSPSLDWFQFTIDGRPAPDGTAAITLPAGTYNLGVACATNLGAGDKFWNAQITVSASSSDPNGFTWIPVPPSVVPESALAIALPLSAVAVGGAVYFIVRRRRDEELVTA